MKNSSSSKNKEDENRVAVIVLGDIGRSPRMQYHTLSISRIENTRVSLIGYLENEPHQQIKNSDNIDIQPLKPFPVSLGGLGGAGGRVTRVLLWPVMAVAKVMFQILQLLYVLLFLVPSPLSTVLVQSPPAIPTVFALKIACMIRGSKLVIDWHNLGYTLLQLSLKKTERHPIIRLAKFIEWVFGKNAYAHLFVTDTMRKRLVADWGLTGLTHVHHDKPTSIFRPMDRVEQADFLQSLAANYKIKDSSVLELLESLQQSRRVSRRLDSKPCHLIVSSTSWTPDEDFSILLDAIVQYEQSPDLQDQLLFIITGGGPLKQYYLEKISKLNLKKSVITTLWLEAKDYPKLLACADLGVSLHLSSSGIDLPMKVVDMFGCSLPVVAMDFECIGELVRNEYNGLLFSNSNQLYQLFNRLFGTPKGKDDLQRMRSNLQKDRPSNTWESSWNQIEYLFKNNVSVDGDVSKSGSKKHKQK
eukprot:gene5934-7389_t